MSFCGGSFCTSCRGASSASGTSGSSLTGGERRCCRCASPSSGRRPTRRPSPTPPRRTCLGRYGFAPSAEAPWRSSNGSPPLRRASALPRSYKKNDYALLFLISSFASAGAPAGEDCPLLVGSHCRASQHPPTAPSYPLDTSFSAYLIVFCHQLHTSKRIA